jgi:hypothetical protein
MPLRVVAASAQPGVIRAWVAPWISRFRSVSTSKKSALTRSAAGYRNRPMTPGLAPRPLLLSSILAISLAVGCGSSDKSTASSSPRVLDPTQTHYGHTADEWGALWFKWLYELQQPASALTDHTTCVIPFHDPTGASCTDGQTYDVFFLAGTDSATVVRNKCTIPAGKAILVPILNYDADNAGVAPAMQMSDTFLQTYVKTQMDGATGMSATMDGAEIPNVASYRTQITKFSYTLGPEPNFYTCLGETGANAVTGPVPTSYAAGFYLLLAPPAVGAHTLHFTGNSPASMPAYSVDVTYNFTVQ